jgi:PST family polysaccharide transporter
MLSFGTAVVMARLLGPEAYGLQAVVVTVTGLFMVLNDVGLSLATIQKSELTAEETNSVFWLQLGISVGVSLAVAAAAPVVGWAFEDPRLVFMTLALAPTFTVIGLYVQHQALLRRAMRYSYIAVTEVLAVGVASVSAVTAAALGAGYWALVIQSAMQFVVLLPACWLGSGWRVGRPHIGPSVRAHINYSKHFLGYKIVEYASKSLDRALLGHFFGIVPLGLYTRANSILTIPMSQIATPLTNVMLPALSRLQSEPERYRGLFLRAVNGVSWACLPASGLLIAAPADWVRVLLGEQWLDAADIFLYSSLGAALMPLSATCAWIFLTTGRTDRMLQFGVVDAVCLTAIVAVAATIGPEEVALARSLWAVLSFVGGLAFAVRTTALAARHVAKEMASPLLAAAAITTLSLVPWSQVSDRVAVRLVLLTISAALISSMVLVGSGEHRRLGELLVAVRRQSRGATPTH